MPEKAGSQTRHYALKALGIKPDREASRTDRVTRGESIISTFSTTDPYVEEDPSTLGWIQDVLPNRHELATYFSNLLPFTQWIMHYNMQWFVGDLVAGVTVGAVVVPQGMAYAKLATLPVQYGLYSSFVGVVVYWLFATSKDITIGPVAVMSKLTGDIVSRIVTERSDLTRAEIAQALALITGGIITGLGVLRLGFVVDFIPLVAIAAFMTGSAISIAAGQVPTIFGINKLFDTRQATYMVIIDTLKHLGSSDINAALGLTALLMLYLIRFFCNWMAGKQPAHRKIWFFANTLRTVFVILLYTLISWLMVRHRRDDPPITIIGTVPRGFQAMGVPKVDADLAGKMASELPVAVIVMLIEHIAISKSFGRVNNYKIDPSQEMIAIGFTNIWAPFFGGYPATGSFSRTAIKSKAGVRTPFGGLISGIVVILALYALPAVFFYIPNAALSAVIIHAVGDLITPPSTLYSFWRISPLEVIIFFAGVFVSVFSSIENGIYTTVAVSAAVMLWRIAKPRGDFLGRISVRTIAGGERRNILRPLDAHGNPTNPSIPVEHPYPGVFIFRFNSDFIYPNVNHYVDRLTGYVLEHTRPTTMNTFERKGDRPWNDPIPRVDEERARQPTLKAVVFDMSAVSHVDVTSVQVFVDVRKQLSRHTEPDPVHFYFANIVSPWTRRALASAGFGYAAEEVQPVFSVASNAAGPVTNEKNGQQHHNTSDEESQFGFTTAEKLGIPGEIGVHSSDLRVGGKLLPIHSIDRPFFSTDVDEAMASIFLNLGVAPPTIANSPMPSPKLGTTTPNSSEGKESSNQEVPAVQLPGPADEKSGGGNRAS